MAYPSICDGCEKRSVSTYWREGTLSHLCARCYRAWCEGEEKEAAYQAWKAAGSGYQNQEEAS